MRFNRVSLRVSFFTFSLFSHFEGYQTLNLFALLESPLKENQKEKL